MVGKIEIKTNLKTVKIKRRKKMTCAKHYVPHSFWLQVELLPVNFFFSGKKILIETFETP